MITILIHIASRSCTPIYSLSIFGATIWTGGHLVLAFTVLPRVLRQRDPAALLKFESEFEKIGIPALVVQVLTGIWLAQRIVPFGQWFELATPQSRVIVLKLALLKGTALFAVDARLRLIPNLNEHNLVALAWHVWPVTLLSVLFVIAGVGFRFGWG